jgi:CRISPR-associated endoribonuclease Cas6
MPSRWEVRLHGPIGVDIPIDAPHEAVSQWLQARSRTAVPPFAVSPPVTRNGITVLEIRLLDDALAPQLVAAAPPGRPVRLGRHHFTVATAPRMSRATPWPDLVETPRRRPARWGAWGSGWAWQLRFVTPATFRYGDAFSPWPAPENVLTSLADRWRALQPATAPWLPREALATVWVSDVEGRSVPLRSDGSSLIGFVGRVRYICAGTDEQGRTVQVLLRFAEYAGVGCHTSCGFGVVRLERIWQPTTAVAVLTAAKESSA